MAETVNLIVNARDAGRHGNGLSIRVNYFPVSGAPKAGDHGPGQARDGGTGDRGHTVLDADGADAALEICREHGA